jgi:hypothetical protein
VRWLYQNGRSVNSSSETRHAAPTPRPTRGAAHTRLYTALSDRLLIVIAFVQIFVSIVRDATRGTPTARGSLTCSLLPLALCPVFPPRLPPRPDPQARHVSPSARPRPLRPLDCHL